MPYTTMLLCCILTIFTSCNGQVERAKGIATKTASIGTTVSEMDKSIWVVHQDKKKNYWFGSNGKGVYRYDGKDLTQFTTKDGLHSDQVRGIQEDRSGTIFFETRTGVTKFDGEKFTSLVPVTSGPGQWKLDPDDLWFKGNGEISGVYRYDGTTLHHLRFSTFNEKWDSPAHAVYSIYKDEQGNIWFGTLSAGVHRFDGTALNSIYEKELSVLDDGRVPAVRYILEDGDGYFWFSNILSRYKILRNDEKGQSAIEYKKENGIAPSKQQVKMKLPYCNSATMNNRDMWMTNYNEGVWKYDGEKLVNFQIKEGAAKALIVSIYKDNAGVLWVATDNAGVYKFTGTGFEKFKP